MLEITFHHVTAEVGQAVNRPVVVLKRTPQVLLRGKGEGGRGVEQKPRVRKTGSFPRAFPSIPGRPGGMGHGADPGWHFRQLYNYTIYSSMYQ